MTNILKKIQDILYFSFSVFLYKFFNIKNSDKSYKIFLKLFYLKGNYFNSVLNFILSHPEKKIKNGNLIISKKIEVEKSVKKLNEDGYFLIKNAIDNDRVEKIKKELSNKIGFYRSDKIEKKEVKLDLNNPYATQYNYYPNDLMNIKGIQEILLDQQLLTLVQKYLNGLPIIDRVNSWYTFPSSSPDDAAAQYWHFDMERPKWLKVFIFLTDCNIDNGPHEFIKESHKPDGIPLEIRRKGYQRISEKEIFNFYPKEKKKIFIVEKGDLLIEDTSGMHKGNQLIKGNRLILQFQYSSSLFGAKNDKIKEPLNKLDVFINTKKNYSKIFQNFYE